MVCSLYCTFRVHVARVPCGPCYSDENGRTMVQEKYLLRATLNTKITSVNYYKSALSEAAMTPANVLRSPEF